MPGAYLLTDRGRDMTHLMWTKNLDWEVAWLLVSASKRTEIDDVSSYILVCMAAIIAHGPRTFVVKSGTLKDDESPYTLNDLQELCSPCVRHCVPNGILWLYTGSFLCYMDSMASSRRSDVTMPLPDAYIVINHAAGSEIGRLVNQFTVMLGLPKPQTKYFTETPLTSQQVTSINTALMWAFLHRTAYFGKEVKTTEFRTLDQDIILGKDCVSLRDIRVDQVREFLDVENCRAYGNRTTQGGGFYAIYNILEQYEDDEGGQYYIAKDLTRLPSSIFRVAEKQNGIPWPEMVISCLD
ncbi:hypothetical protein F4859DRAFT_514383 [Xylaria cf. heliscus]|nr:hypothetical protein F4859DRAFT_514383 [Xylaria cf. heliscus]